MILATYNILLWCLFPFLVLHFIKGRLSLRKYTRPISERLGFFRLPNRKKNRFTILVHAVSVGETVAAQPFVEELKKRFPDIEIIFSTVTETGYKRSREIIPADFHVFFPLDYSSCVDRFLNLINPQQVFILETEIWPNFIAQCEHRGINVNFINGRISDKSFRHYSTFRWLIKSFLSHPRFFMQTEEDLIRIKSLGAKYAEVVGNLKYDQLLYNLKAPARQAIQSLFKDIDPPIVVYGSTHREETKWILKMVQELSTQGRSWRHIIAPRHLNFLPEYVSFSRQLDLKTSLRSEFSGEEFDVMFLNTYGELANLYEGATVCVVGGSFENIGGHSILEPALFSRPILYGPNTQNFREICRRFELAGASSKVQNIEDLRQKLELFIDNESLRRHLGEQAGNLAAELTGATQQILDSLMPEIVNFQRSTTFSNNNCNKTLLNS